jgi:hypothetical protein
MDLTPRGAHSGPDGPRQTKVRRRASRAVVTPPAARLGTMARGASVTERNRWCGTTAVKALVGHDEVHFACTGHLMTSACTRYHCSSCTLPYDGHGCIRTCACAAVLGGAVGVPRSESPSTQWRPPEREIRDQCGGGSERTLRRGASPGLPARSRPPAPPGPSRAGTAPLPPGCVAAERAPTRVSGLRARAR